MTKETLRLPVGEIGGCARKGRTIKRESALGDIAILVLSALVAATVAIGVGPTAYSTIMSPLIQVIVFGGCFYWRYHRAHRRARRLLRRLVRPEQYDEYRRTGHLTEWVNTPRGQWRAIVYPLGVRWTPPEYGLLARENVGVWECIYPVSSTRLCRADRILTQLLRARHGEFARRYS